MTLKSVHVLAAASALCAAQAALAVPAALQNATADFSQDGFPVGNAINGNAGDGWAGCGSGGICNGDADDVSNVTAAFETVTDTPGGPGLTGTDFVFTTDYVGFGTHTLGRFRFSVTTDDRSTFADGLPNGGDVTANWTVVTPTSVTSNNPGTTFSIQGDGSILAGGTAAERETYTVNGSVGLTGVTGIRLEMIEDPSLPGSGPGRGPTNGNFVLYELTADATAVPEPAALSLLGVGGLLALRRKGS